MSQKIRAHHADISAWIQLQAKASPPPFYCSVDLRDSGHKIVPVDSNLYPAGFNNICPEDLRTAPPMFRRALGAGVSKLLIIPESHTSNLFYLENLFYLRQLALDSGLEVEVGWYPTLEGAPAPQELRSESGKILKVVALTIQNGRLMAGAFDPDAILLNNDFSGGYPKILDSVTQPVVPSASLGWHSRKKSTHFKHYNALAAEFATLIGIDPWSIQIETLEVAPVHFNDGLGIEETARAVDNVLAHTRQSYLAHGINRAPFAYVKNNSGTYGMGIMVAHSGDEVRAMNRRSKNKMSVGKNRMQIASVAVQEGVPTATLIDRLPAEPVIYLLGSELMGGFLRTNTERNDEDNLNSQGMVFRKLCMSDMRDSLEEGTAVHSEGSDPSELELVYGTVARLSALATGRELLARQS